MPNPSLPALIGGSWPLCRSRSGFRLQLLEQTPASPGNAYAGSGGCPQKMPAHGILQSRRHGTPARRKKHVAVGLNTHQKFSDNGSVNPSHRHVAGANNGGDAGSLAAVPHAYFTHATDRANKLP